MICPNCCEELIEKKYKKSKWVSNRLKCMDCGYETSKYETEKENEEFLDSLRKKNPYEEEMDSVD